MKHLAIITATAALAALAVPAQAADLPNTLAPATIFNGFKPSASPLPPVAGYGNDRWDDSWNGRRDWRGRDDRRWDDGRRLGPRDRVWRGKDGRFRCRRNDGTTGLVIGAGVGALVGRTIDTRGDRTLGTLLGAVGGGLLGREIERGDLRCR